MKNAKKVFFITILVMLLIGLTAISAANDTSHDSTTSKNTHIEQSTVQKDTTVIKNTEKQKIITKNNNKTVKQDTSTIDYYVSDNTGSDTNTGTSESPFKTIQTALNKTSADNTYNIHILEGTYKGLGNTNLTVNGNYNINLIGSGINKTIFDGEAKYDIDTMEYHWESSDIWSFYVNESGNYFMTIEEGNGQISISDLLVTKMYSRGGTSIESYPHATIDNYANLKVNNVYFNENYAGVGSAIRNNKDATLIVNNSFFENNKKSSSTGNEGTIYNNGTATILNSLFNHNYARWGTVLNDKNITMINTTLSNNIGYDGNSAYKYGPGFAFNTGAADFYNLGWFLTYNNVINCTFINNQQADIYGFYGNLVAEGNNFINSTGVILTEGEENYGEVTYDLSNNTFIDLKPSIYTTLQSQVIDKNTLILRTHALSSNTRNNVIFSNNSIKTNNGTIIEVNKAEIINNTVEIDDIGTSIVLNGEKSLVVNNTLNKQMNVSGNNNTITNNKIETDNEYAINLARIRYNTVAKNELIAPIWKGDAAVSRLNAYNTVENNTPAFPDYIFVSPNVVNPTTGSMDNPTTLADAITKVKNEGIIFLVPNRIKTVTLTDTININGESVTPNVEKFTIAGYTDGMTIDANQKQVFNIAEGFDITIANITFENAKSDYGGIIYSESNLNIENCIFKNSESSMGGALFINKTAEIKVSNSTFENIKSDNEANYYNTTGKITLNNNQYHNSSILYNLNLVSSTTEKSHLNDIVTININDVALVNPEFYDTTLSDNQVYYYYVNNEFVGQTNNKKYEISIQVPYDYQTYVIPEFTTIPSTTLNIEVEYNELINVNINTPEVTSFFDVESYFVTNVTDEFNVPVTTGKVEYYLNDELIGITDVENGIATAKTPIMDTVGVYNVLVKYIDSSGKYQNTTGNTRIIAVDKIYVSPDVNTPQAGTIENPTTLEDAITKISDNKTIILLKGTDGIYKLEKTPNFTEDTLSTKINTVNLVGENVTIDGQNQFQILYTNQDITFNINNITFTNAYGNRIINANQSYANFNLQNVNFINNTVTFKDLDYLFYTKGNITMDTIVFSNNTGRGIYAESANIILTGENTFTHNQFPGLYYTDMYLLRSTNITLNGKNTFYNNTYKYLSSQSNININGTNYFINNTGSILSGTNIVLSGKNYFINNTGVEAGSVVVRNLNTGGENYFINNKNIQGQGRGAAIYVSYMQANILIEDVVFINNTGITGGSIYSTGTVNINNCTFINDSATKGGSIYTGIGALTVENSTFIGDSADMGAAICSDMPFGTVILTNNHFINCTSPQETLWLQTQRSTFNNNTYINSDIQVKTFKISLNPETATPIIYNENITILINEITLNHTNYYDSNILENSLYDIIVNDELIGQTVVNAKNYTILANKVDELTTYITPSFTTAKSNIITLDVEKDNLKNTIIIVENTYVQVNSSAIVKVNITDKEGKPIESIGKVYIYQENELLGQNDVVDGSTEITTVNIEEPGAYNITVIYQTEEKYNNKTITSMIIANYNDVYVDLNLKTPNMGTKENPTTLEDAITKINQYGTIHILPSTDNTYIIDNPIIITLEDTSYGINTFNISSENSNITLNAKGLTRILEISSGLTIQINNISFINADNSAIQNNGTLIINGNCNFDNNMANKGGSIYNTGILIINGTNTFQNNVASSGGVIYSTGKVDIIGENTFKNNKIVSVPQQDGGGAITVMNSNLTIEGQNKFINNSAHGSQKTWGGAILLNIGTLRINGKNLFENNSLVSSANSNGGTIYSKGITLINGSNIFRNSFVDSVNGGGGTIYAISGDLNITGSNLFTSSSATGTGGTILTTSSTLIIEGTNTFNNSKANNGGIIYNTDGMNIIGENRFENSNATFGGVMSIDGTSTSYKGLNITGSIFHNITSTRGGTIFIEGASTQRKGRYSINNIIQSTFENITTSGGVIQITDWINSTKIVENTFKNIQSDDETLLLSMDSNEKTISDNTYINCTIGINEFKISSIYENQEIYENVSIPLSMELSLLHPDYYDSNILDSIEYNIYINGENKYNTTEKQISIDEEYPEDTQGLLNIKATTTQINQESNNITITLIKVLKPIVNITTETAVIGETTNITAEFYKDNQPVNGGLAIFRVNGKTLRDNDGNVIYVPVVDGKAELPDVNITAEWMKPDTSIQAVYSGTDEFDPIFTEKTYINVTKPEATISITSPTESAAPGQTVTLTATVTDNNVPISSGRVVFKLNGKTLKDETGKALYVNVANGVANITYTLPVKTKANTYKLTAVYTDSMYDRVQADVDFVVTA